MLIITKCGRQGQSDIMSWFKKLLMLQQQWWSCSTTLLNQFRISNHPYIPCLLSN